MKKVKNGKDIFKHKIKAVIFDVNGVILNGKNRIVHKEISKKLKIKDEAWLDAIDVYWNELVKNEKIENVFLEHCANVAHTSKKKVRELFVEEYKKKFILNKEVYNLIKSLKGKYKIGILSDQVPFSYIAIQKFKLDELVHRAIWSQKVGLRKPNPQIYKLILKKLNVKPKNSVFIDDRDWNLIPAHRLGMKTILFQDAEQLKKDLTKFGVRI